MEKLMEQPIEKETTNSNKTTNSNPFAPNKSFFFDALAKYKSEHQSDTNKLSPRTKRLIKPHEDEIRATLAFKQAA
jgi:hypothetical protein